MKDKEVLEKIGRGKELVRELRCKPIYRSINRKEHEKIFRSIKELEDILNLLEAEIRYGKTERKRNRKS